MNIRRADQKDFPKILELIQELAEYENASDQVTNSVKQMQEERDLFFCYVLENDGKILGIALCFYAYFTWVGKSLYLDDLYVQKEHRQKGYGKALLKKVFKTARENNCKRIRWQVLEWNRPAIEFYQSLNATINKEWYNCDFTQEGMDII